jgi:nucleoside-diphosphate-sugar epimerase
MAINNASEQRPPRFLLTGAKGFIGSWIVKTLIERGLDPWVYDLDQEAHRLRALLTGAQLERLHFIRGDVTCFEELERAVLEHGISQIIHLAALQVPACAADPPLGARVNILGTLNVFEVARRHRDQVRRIVYASSQAVFGPEEFYGGNTVPEGAPLLPNTHYGVFKQANEGNARVYYLTEGVSSVGLRPGTVYGAGRDRGITSGPTKAIKAAVAGRPYTLKLTGGVDLQYVRDTAEIFVRSAESRLEGAKAYTPRGEVIQIEEFLKVLCRLLPQAKELVRADGKPLPIAYDFDDSALVRDLGAAPRTPIEQGVRETMEIFERLKREGRLDLSDLED